MVPFSSSQPSSKRRKEPPRVIISRRGRLTSYTLRPWLFGSIASVFVLFGTGYIGGTAYLFYRDGLLDAAVARQAELQHVYEDRIARLRGEIDKVTSKHLVETQSMEEQLATLLDRQEAIFRRQSLLDDVMQRAEAAGISIAETRMTTPRPRPERPFKQLAAAPEDRSDPEESQALGYAEDGRSRADIITGSIFAHPGEAEVKPAAAKTSALESDKLRPLLKSMDGALRDSFATQLDAAAVLSAASYAETERLETTLNDLGFSNLVPRKRASTGDDATGGPFVPVDGDAALRGLAFVETIDGIDSTLANVRDMRRKLASLPLGRPIIAPRSSGFGYRTDPFLKRPALHTGIDFRAVSGSPVRATAPGEVVEAGWNGGYGKMIEIRHAHGVSTRYGHLSRIDVKVGDKITTGEVIGRVGSTGRSTGPHLHYETRRDGRPEDPTPFLKTERFS
ncbi:M23 family metallopeptidase [Rhodopseudomonas julia]|nr:M23 family metallopeptidase [Rhodopseudomonas julia]